jgi:hypothetical protein
LAKGVYAFEMVVSQVLLGVGVCPRRGIWDQRPPAKERIERRERLAAWDAMFVLVRLMRV